MADVENPPRIAARIAGQRRGDLGERQSCGVDRRLQHAVVEEACRAIARPGSCRSAGPASPLGSSACASQRASRAISSADGALDMPPLSRAKGAVHLQLQREKRAMADEADGPAAAPAAGCATRRRSTTTTPICATAGCASGRPARCRSPSRTSKQADVAWEQRARLVRQLADRAPAVCRECGTSLGFVFTRGSDKLDLTVASFDDPSRFVPKQHFGAESMHRAWLDTEGLPEHTHQRLPEAGRQMGRGDGQLPGLTERDRSSLDRVRRRRARLARVGEGRPVILLHGLFSDAPMNWINFGHADAHRRGGLPGDHARPARARRSAASRTRRDAYPPGILVRDLAELVAHLGLADFDLGGFSLGARTVVAGGRRGRCGRARRCSPAWACAACRTGTGARRSSATRSPISTPLRAATRTGWRSSS